MTENQSGYIPNDTATECYKENKKNNNLIINLNLQRNYSIFYTNIKILRMIQFLLLIIKNNK